MLSQMTEVLRPASLAEAAALLRRPGLRVLAGGSELTGGAYDPEIRAVVDLSGLGLAEIRVGADGWHLGAMVTLAALEAEESLRLLPGNILGRAAHLSAPRTLRNAATLGGTVVGSSASPELTTALLALGARVELCNPSPMQLPLAEVLARKAELFPGALLTAITLAPPAVNARAGLARVARTPADVAIACAVALVEVKDDRIQEARIALGGLAPAPALLAAAMQLAGQSFAAPAVTRAAETAAALASVSDIRGSAEYRRWIAPVLVRRALEEAR